MGDRDGRHERYDRHVRRASRSRVLGSTPPHTYRRERIAA